MKRLVLAILGSLMCYLVSSAQNTPRWLRQNAISPDGSTIAFVYQGDIFTVPVGGGRATQLTTNPAHDTEPLWSADGKTIVFASVREGSKDIWAMPAEGGTPVRLTTYGGSETPLAVGPDGKVYFSANIQEDPVSSVFPGKQKMYYVDMPAILEAAEGAEDDNDTALMKARKPVQISSNAAGYLSVNASGTIIYEDIKGYEDSFRKHHTSSVTRDIWKLENGSYTKLTSFVGEDRNPVFASDGRTFYYLSEQETGNEKPGDWAGNMNIWQGNLYGSSPIRLTSFKDNPVRYLSVSNNGTLCFSQNGDLYTMQVGSTPKKVEITLVKDKNEKEHILRTSIFGSRSMSISPNGKEVALTARGEVYTTTLELGDTKRITKTPEQERVVSFGKDGKVLFYDSERDGEWGIYKAELGDSKDKFFTFSHKIKEERFTPEGETCFQPQVSPDGKWVAYLRDRTELVIKPVSGGKEKVLLPKDTNYSYSDGDLLFSWSPDSKHLLTTYQGEGRMYNEDVAVIDVSNGKLTDLTESGYSDGNARWALGGKAMTWESDKAGYRSHGSWGSEGDVYIMFFDDEEFAKFKKDKDVIDIEKLLSEDSKKKKKDEADSTKKDEKKKPETVKLELDRRAERVVKLTINSASLRDHLLSPEGDKLYYIAQLEKTRDLCCLDIKKSSIKVLKRGVTGSLYPSPDDKCFFLMSSLGIDKIEYSSGSSKSVSFRGEYEYFPDKERAYIFEHCWKQVAEKFYDPDMHGVDWAAQKANYEQFMPYIADNYAFQELLSEMLGELNGSHTGGRYRDMSGVGTGHLGVLFDTEYEGKGLKIKEILPESLLRTAYPDLKEGDTITAIDNEEIPEGQQWYDALSQKVKKRILLTINGKKEVYVKPTGNDSDALYRRWVEANEKKVEELSGGKIGYVHVKGMNSPSFREVYSKALGKYRNCDALIVDTRHNGGGWLHNDLATFLDGKLYTIRQPRGVYMAPEPYDKWIKPSCVLVCEDNYSDACGFPYVYRSLGTGKIIGAPVPGTATSVWWETQIDPTLIFGIPQVGSYSVKEGRYLENLQLEPDITVYNDPAATDRGEDAQLEAAVREMMK